MDMFTNLSEVPGALKAENFSELMEARGLNIIEKGIIEAFLMKFSTHWDIETKKFEGPTSVSESWVSTSVFNAKSVEIAEIRKIFKHNPLIVKSGVLVGTQISIPPDCKVDCKSTDKSREIIFSNPYVILDINFRASSGGVAQQGIWGALISDPTNMNRYSLVEYRVDVTMTIKRTKTYSPEMKSYRRWYENICDILSGYDWNVVDKKIERSLSREAISKILGL
jgi:hypothetical protein